jgi:hypothetical protein
LAKAYTNANVDMPVLVRTTAPPALAAVLTALKHFKVLGRRVSAYVPAWFLPIRSPPEETATLGA